MTASKIPARRLLLDLGASVLLLTVSIVGFWPTFAGPSYLVAAVGGLVLGTAIAVLGALLRWGIFTIAGITAAVYLLFGGALALPQTTVVGVVPTLDTVRLLAIGVVTSWKQLLTTVAPVAASDGHLIVPFILTLVATVLTASFALRLRHVAWALVPAAAFLALQIALGTSQPAFPVIQGIVFAVVAICWLALREAWTPTQSAVSLGGEDAASRGATVRRLIAGGAVVAIAVTVGVAGNAVAAPDPTRYVLRDVVIPPFEVKAYPSPLQSFRAYVRDDAEAPLFTVTGLPAGARVRIATMDAYDGTVYNVSDEGAGSSSAFTPVRTDMSPEAVGTPVTLAFEMDDYRSVWMPGAGAVTNVEFDGARADDLRRSAHYNASTETGVVTSRLQQGDGYTLSTRIAEEPKDAALADAGFAPVKMPKQVGVPQEFADLAAKAVADATSPIEQARALEQTFSEGGFFSHGLEGEVLSRAGHGAARISSLLGSEQMVGDDEQYATAMALLARDLGMPARVVMGFYPDEDQAKDAVFTATGDSLHAWVEIAFDGAGWLTFDPTPPEDQLPTDQSTKPRVDPKPQVLQPPPPEQQPVDLPPTVPDDRESQDETPIDLSTLFAIIAWSAAGLLLLALIAAPFIVIGVLKSRRRRRRLAAARASDRISGGWDELRDRAVDYGTPVVPGATHGEDAAVIATAFAEPRVTTLARRADAEVFGPSDPSPADVEAFWRQVDEIVQGMGSGSSLWRRLRARASMRSLLASTRFARVARPRTASPRSDVAAPTDSEDTND